MFLGEVLRLELRSSGDSRANSYVVFFSPSAWRFMWCSSPTARLGWAAAVGLDVKEVNALLEGSGFSVRGIDRKDGVVCFVLANGSVVSVPVFFEVQSNGTGFFVVGNPSCVDVTYVAVVRFSKGGVKGEMRFNLTVSPLDAVVLAPAVFRSGDGESEASLFLYAPPGAYSLGNFSAVFDRERLVAGNRSILLRWLHAVFLPPEVRKLVDAVGWCNLEFWKAFDEVSDSYDYALLGDVALTVIPVGKLGGFFGKVLARGAETAGGVISAVKAAVYALSSSKWARAVGAAAGYVIPDVFIAEDIRQLLDPAAAEEVFSAFDIDITEVERFHAGILTVSSCRNAGKYYAAVYVSWVTKASAAVDLVSNLYAKVSKDALERFGRSFVAVAERARRFDVGTHAAYIAARGWGPHDVDDRVWDEAVSKLTKALKGRDDVGTVIQLSRMGVITVEEGKLKAKIVYDFTERSGYITVRGHDVVVKSIGGRDVYFVAAEEKVGGGFFVGFSDDKSFYRWTNYGFFQKLRSVGIVKNWDIVKAERGTISANKNFVQYVCVEASFGYASEYMDVIEEILTRGSTDKASTLAQWRQKFAMVAAFSLLEEAFRKVGFNSRLRYYAYEVDLPPAEEIEIVNRVGIAGLVGYLRQNNIFLGELPRFVAYVPGIRQHSKAPDGVALFKEGGVGGVYLLEVGSQFDQTLEKFFGGGGLFEGLGGAGVIRGCKSGVCLTNFGVALVGFRTDAVGGATVGAMAAGPVSGSVLAYPQVKTSLVEWAELLNREAVVRPVFGVYEEVQRGVYRLRLLALDTWINDAAAVKEAWGRCWR